MLNALLLASCLAGQDSAKYRIINGWAVVEGDIIVGSAKELEARAKKGDRAALATPRQAQRWLRNGAVYQVPYTNSSNYALVNDAIRSFNQTFAGVIQWVPRTQEADYVDFQVQPGEPGECSMQSAVGRSGGMQPITGTGQVEPFCIPVMLHEMGHALGLLHEQSRSDRDGHVKVIWPNITDRTQYDKEAGSADSGLYDAASIMHYAIGTFALDTQNVTMEAIPTGVRLKTEAYSPGDIDVIRRMYGATPQQVQVVTNPPGLQVAIDDRVVVAGSAESTATWALNSTHTLDVPEAFAFQTLNGKNYVFGRWNNLPYDPNQPGRRQTVTATPGDGALDLTNSARPRYTVYQANFRSLLPAEEFPQAQVEPAGGGQVNVVTAPVRIQNRDFYYNLQPVDVRAVPAAGYSFYGWDIGTEINVAANPRTVRPGLLQNITARFTQSPVTTLQTNPSGLKVKVDGQEYTGSRSFAAPFDEGWGAGATHNVSVDTPQASVVDDPNARFVFSSWSDNGQAAHDITVGNTSTVLTANFATQYQLNIQTATQNNCAGGVQTNPAAMDASYFTAGTEVTLTAQPGTGWNFTGWELDLTGNANPAKLTLDRSRSVRALFNITPDPFLVTSVSPTSTAVNAADFTLTINGSGFSSQTTYCVFDADGTESRVCGATTFVSGNQLQVRITQDLLNKAQRLGVQLYNADANGCSLNIRTGITVQ
ncbi:MAG: M12 family metallopeptidase [Bryobacteraceae bacterium]|nr:M12 family metallopeptidase [Bryobacteraceae bacterium]